jgi:hypothetical protein
MSKNAGKSEMKEANSIARGNVERLEALDIPTVEAQEIALKYPELVGLLEAQQLGPSSMENVSIDPRLRGAQLAALDEMTGLGQTGLGAEDRAAFNQFGRQSAGQAQAEQASSLQEMARRGTLDSGTSFIAQLLSGQASADRMSMEGDRLAANAAAARRAALGQQADMATQMAGQQLSLDTNKVSTKDQIDRFNKQNKQDVDSQNLNTQQQLSTRGNDIYNIQETSNKGLIQQDLQNRFQKAGGVSQANNLVAAGLQAQATAAQQAQQAMVSGVINAGTTLGAASMKKSPSAGGGGSEQTAKSGYGGGAPANSYDDNYMNKIGK